MVASSARRSYVNDFIVGKTVSGTYRYSYKDEPERYTIYFVDENYCNITYSYYDRWHLTKEYENVPYKISGSVFKIKFNWKDEADGSDVSAPVNSIKPFKVSINDGGKISMSTLNFHSGKSLYLFE